MAPEAAPGRANPARGIALIATAVILGLFILRQGFTTIDSADASGGALGTVQQDDEAPDESGQPEGEGNQGQGNGGGGGGGNGDGNEQQEPQVRPPSDLTVQVANTTGVSGAACNWSSDVAGSGYQTTEPRQASGDARTTSAVVHRQGLAAEGQELATAVGVSGDAVTVLEGQPPADIEGVSLMGDDVQLLLLLGEDLAGPVDGVACPE